MAQLGLVPVGNGLARYQDVETHPDELRKKGPGVQRALRTGARFRRLPKGVLEVEFLDRLAGGGWHRHGRSARKVLAAQPDRDEDHDEG